jgi:T-complex protein 1 subunit eta
VFRFWRIEPEETILIIHTPLLLGDVTISNDGATILKQLDIVHPAGKALVDIARAQDAEVGDGTTSVVLLAGELLREAKPYIEEGVPSQTVIKGFRTASHLVGLDLKP